MKSRNSVIGFWSPRAFLIAHVVRTNTGIKIDKNGCFANVRTRIARELHNPTFFSNFLILIYHPRLSILIFPSTTEMKRFFVISIAHSRSRAYLQLFAKVAKYLPIDLNTCKSFGKRQFSTPNCIEIVFL